MQTFETAAFPAVSYSPVRSTRPRYTILCDRGFLRAHPDTPATEIVLDPGQATLFVDFDVAASRARLLSHCGWRNLRVTEIGIPSSTQPHP